MILRKGYYETEYGNTALYTGGKTAKDLDSGVRIPLELLDKFLRPLKEDKHA